MFSLLAVVVALAAPAPVVTTTGAVVGVAQDSSGGITWLSNDGVRGCRLHLPSRVVRYAPGCGFVYDLALAPGRVAWGGYDEVRCSETTASVWATAGARARQVDNIIGDCTGYDSAFQGLTSDGTNVYYSVLSTQTPGGSFANCGNGGPCKWVLKSGKVFRISPAGRRKVVAGLPPAALLAGADGRLATVPAAAAASSNGKTFDWPRARLDARVAVRRTSDWSVVTSFRPRGVVRGIALSASRAVVLVSSGLSRRIEWYDLGSGAMHGSAHVPPATDGTLSTDGRFVAFVVASTVRVLDLSTGAQRIVGQAPFGPGGISVVSGRLVWGQNRGGHGRVLAVQL